MIPVCAPQRRQPTGRRQLPPRPKSCAHYQRTAPLVDTGLTARRCAQLRSRLRHFCRMRADEVFRRVSVETLVTLMVDVQRLLRATDSEEPGPYLLLDVRDSVEYRAGHIATALHFSPQRLSRTTEFDTPMLRLYRDRSDAVIVVYDSDERSAPRVATVLTQRGYDNVFLLSGGLRLATAMFPAALLKSGDYQTTEEQLSEEQLQQLEAVLQQLGTAETSGSVRAPSVTSVTQ